MPTPQELRPLSADCDSAYRDGYRTPVHSAASSFFILAVLHRHRPSLLFTAESMRCPITCLALHFPSRSGTLASASEIVISHGIALRSTVASRSLNSAGSSTAASAPSAYLTIRKPLDKDRIQLQLAASI